MQMKDMSSAPIKIYVGNVPLSARNSELKELFEKFGKVIECDILKDFAFVHMDDTNDAKAAIAGLHDTLWKGSRIRVELSTTRTNKGEPSERYNSRDRDDSRLDRRRENMDRFGDRNSNRLRHNPISRRPLSDRDSMYPAPSYYDRRGDSQVYGEPYRGADKSMRNGHLDRHSINGGPIRDSRYPLDRRGMPIYPPVDPYGSDYRLFNGRVNHYPPSPSYHRSRGDLNGGLRLSSNDLSHELRGDYISGRGSDSYGNGSIMNGSDRRNPYPSGGGPIRNGQSYPIHSGDNLYRGGPPQSYPYPINSRYDYDNYLPPDRASRYSPPPPPSNLGHHRRNYSPQPPLALPSSRLESSVKESKRERRRHHSPSSSPPPPTSSTSQHNQLDGKKSQSSRRNHHSASLSPPPPTSSSRRSTEKHTSNSSKKSSTNSNGKRLNSEIVVSSNNNNNKSNTTTTTSSKNKAGSLSSSSSNLSLGQLSTDASVAKTGAVSSSRQSRSRSRSQHSRSGMSSASESESNASLVESPYKSFKKMRTKAY